MKRIKNFVWSVVMGKTPVTDMYRYYTVSTVIMMVHVCLFVVAMLLGSVPLMVCNALSVPSNLLIMICFVRRRKFVISFYLIYLEIFLNTMACCVVVGWTYGFSLYNLVVVPVSFYMAFMSTNFKKRTTTACVCGILNVVGTMAFRIYVYTHGPIEVYSTNTALVISVFNMLIAFAVVTFFSILYIIEIRSSRAELERMNEELRDMANHDNLTRLYNRNGVKKVMEETFENARVMKKKFCIAVCDIDDFKKVNDTYGHDVGDIVLKRIAKIMNDALLYGDIVCRWGGEEFLFIICQPLKSATAVLEKIRKTVMEERFTGENYAFSVTLTTGVAEYHDDLTQDEVIKRADMRLYYGKIQGKNCIITQSEMENQA